MELPRHLEEFSHISTNILQRAHDNTLEPYDATLSLGNDTLADRVYIEKKNRFQPGDYERLAIHLGHDALTVCLEHRHQAEQHQPLTRLTYPRATIHLEGNQMRAYYSRIIREGHQEELAYNEEAGRELTDRLFRSIAIIGIDAVRFDVTPSTIDLPQAS